MHCLIQLHFTGTLFAAMSHAAGHTASIRHWLPFTRNTVPNLTASFGTGLSQRAVLSMTPRLGRTSAARAKTAAGGSRSPSAHTDTLQCHGVAAQGPVMPALRHGRSDASGVESPTAVRHAFAHMHKHCPLASVHTWSALAGLRSPQATMVHMLCSVPRRARPGHRPCWLRRSRAG